MRLIDDTNYTLHLKVLSSDGVVYEGDVKAFTSENEIGKFDVLPKHENFISVIQSFLRIYDSSGKYSELEIDKGILEVYQDRAEIYLGI